MSVSFEILMNSDRCGRKPLRSRVHTGGPALLKYKYPTRGVTESGYNEETLLDTLSFSIIG